MSTTDTGTTATDTGTTATVDASTQRPDRVDTAATTFGSTADLSRALIRAAIAHGEHEKRTGAEDPNWPGWYAAYMVAEQAGAELPV